MKPQGFINQDVRPAPSPVKKKPPRLARLKPYVKKLITRRVVVTTGSFIVLIFVALVLNARQDIQNNSPTAVTRQEAEVLKDQVGTLIELPADETPTVATVADTDKLKGQAFFVNAKTGDKVLIFSQAKKAVLYRPSTNKVIEFAPLNLGNESFSPDTP